MSCEDFQDVLAWTSPAGLARGLYMNTHWNAGFTGIFARIWLSLLLLVPLLVGLTEITLGMMHRHSPAACAQPLPAWVIVDGSAALLMVILCLIDISKIQALKKQEEQEELQGLIRPVMEAAIVRQRRSDRIGGYAVLGFTIIVLIPLFRLIWLMYGIDILYNLAVTLLLLLILGALVVSMLAFAIIFLTSYRTSSSAKRA